MSESTGWQVKQIAHMQPTSSMNKRSNASTFVLKSRILYSAGKKFAPLYLSTAGMELLLYSGTLKINICMDLSVTQLRLSTSICLIVNKI